MLVAPLPGTMVTANVRLSRPLGEGGMGSVWVADHLSLKTQVAVKFVYPELAKQDPAVIARFNREATIAAQIKNLHVVQTFDHGVMEDGTPFIVMELLEGESLAARLERAGRLTLRQTRLVVTQVAKVLHQAHELGIIHRDIKPANLFLVASDYELFVKVLDFGIAKQAQAPDTNQVTATGSMVGTPHYMSPELLLRAKQADFRADLWALAVVAYHALTGRVPFEGETLVSTSIAITKGEFTRPSEIDRRIPVALDQWFTRALNRDPERRFPSAKQLAGAFVRAIAAGPASLREEAEVTPKRGGAMPDGARAVDGFAHTLRGVGPLELPAEEPGHGGDEAAAEVPRPGTKAAPAAVAQPLRGDAAPVLTHTLPLGGQLAAPAARPDQATLLAPVTLASPGATAPQAADVAPKTAPNGAAEPETAPQAADVAPKTAPNGAAEPETAPNGAAEPGTAPNGAAEPETAPNGAAEPETAASDEAELPGAEQPSVAADHEPDDEPDEADHAVPRSSAPGLPRPTRLTSLLGPRRLAMVVLVGAVGLLGWALLRGGPTPPTGPSADASTTPGPSSRTPAPTASSVKEASTARGDRSATTPRSPPVASRPPPPLAGSPNGDPYAGIGPRGTASARPSGDDPYDGPATPAASPSPTGDDPYDSPGPDRTPRPPPDDPYDAPSPPRPLARPPAKPSASPYD